MNGDSDIEEAAEIAVFERRYNDAEQLLLGLEDSGSPYVLRTLGWMNETGVSSNPSVEKAIAYYRSAIEAGSKRAIADLGIALSGAARDSEAIPFLRKAADDGSLSAIYHLSMVLLRQDNEEHRSQGRKFLKRASRRGHLYATQELITREYQENPNLLKLIGYYKNKIKTAVKIPT